MRIVLDDGAYMPLRGHADDAGLDLRTPTGVVVPAGGSVVIDTGVHMAIPRGYYGKIESKSGLTFNYGVVSPWGVVDSGFVGSIKVKIFNFGGKDYTFSAGDKICQIVLMPCLIPDLEIVDRLDDTERGANGYGSTGR